MKKISKEKGVSNFILGLRKIAVAKHGKLESQNGMATRYDQKKGEFFLNAFVCFSRN